jgi:plasmid stabilization system protein ParE
MAVEIIGQPQALNDISDIAEFISKASVNYARVQTKRFFERAAVLENFPLSGRIVPELGTDQLRELIIGPYRMIYYVTPNNRIEILTIHHGGMLLSNNTFFKEDK